MNRRTGESEPTIWGEIGILVAAVVLGMSPWFSATVVGAPMVRSIGYRDSAVVWLTLAVQFGFVLGSLISARYVLADRLSPRHLAAVSAGIAAVSTALLTVPGLSMFAVLSLRMVCGAALAGVYPPSIKVAAGWTVWQRGVAVGLLVGGTTLGSAVPHLLRLAVDPSAWRGVLWLSALCAATGAWLFAVRVRQGPFQAASAPFDPRALGSVLRNRRVMLATGGYLGHMWELYAMWSSIGLFLAYAGGRRGWSADAVALSAFLTVAVGALGCAYAGWAADRVGRSTVTMAAMSISGLCALVVGLAVDAPAAVLLLVTLVWGVSIVADSAQFSAAVTESAEASYVGTALTVQTALGFLLTMVTIQLVPWFSSQWGWRWAFAPLALGPVVGIVCMRRLQRLEPGLRPRSPTSSGTAVTR